MKAWHVLDDDSEKRKHGGIRGDARESPSAGDEHRRLRGLQLERCAGATDAEHSRSINVIRCKDCRWSSDEYPEDGDCYCKRPIQVYELFEAPKWVFIGDWNFYCAAGEPKED